jgi:hypothetical protein
VSARLDQDARGMIIDRASGDGHDTSARQPWHPGPPCGRCRPNQRHRTVTRDRRRSDLLRHTTRPRRRLSLPHRRPRRRDAPGKPSAPTTITRRIPCIVTPGLPSLLHHHHRPGPPSTKAENLQPGTTMSSSHGCLAGPPLSTQLGRPKSRSSRRHVPHPERSPSVETPRVRPTPSTRSTGWPFRVRGTPKWGPAH